MDEPLEKLLEDLHGQAESAGRFSVELSQAQGKIGGLQNLQGLYLLKLVQAAVAGGCSGVAIRLGRREVSVQAQGEAPTFTRQDLEQALRGPFQAQSSPALQHLAWGLLLAQPWESLQVEVADGLYDSRLGWQDGGTATGFALRLERHRSLVDWLTGLVAASKEHALVYQRCCYAPIPVSLDRRWVNEPDRLDRLLPQGTLSPPSMLTFTPWSYYVTEMLAERNLLTSGEPRFLASLPTMKSGRYLRLGEQSHCAMTNTLNMSLSGATARSTAVHLHQWLFDPPQPQWKLSQGDRPLPGTYPFLRANSVGGFTEVVESVDEKLIAPYLSAVAAGLPRPYNLEPTEWNGKCRNFERPLPLVNLRLTLPLGLTGPAHLIPVLHGVALDPVDLDLPYPGLLAVATRDGLATDLSQLKLVQNQTYQGLRQDLDGHAREMCAEVKAVLAPHYPDWVRQYIIERLPDS